MPNIRQPNVMVFTPILNLQPATVGAILKLAWGGPLTLVMQRDNPTGKPTADHLHQYQRGRELFLKGDFDAMLIIEDDIVPPVDTLQRLHALDCDVAYGAYLFKAGGVVNLLERHPGGMNPGESLSLRYKWPAHGVIDVAGSGLGCVLIQRHVIEAQPFSGDCSHFFDSDWTKQVYQAGWEMRADTAVLCEHI